MSACSIPPLRPKWRGTLTDRERFRRQLHRQPVDRCFNMEFGYWDDNFRLWPFFRDAGIRTNDEADVFLNFDRTVPVFTPWISPPFPEEEISRTATTRILRNAEGLLAEVPLDGHDTIPHFLESSVKTPDDWKRVKEERFRLDDPARQVDLAALLRAHPLDRDYPLGVYTISMIGKVRDLLTVEGLAYAVYDYPEMVEDMVETSCQIVEHHLDQVLPHLAFDYAHGWEDICYRSGPLVSVDFFRAIVVPRYQRIRDKLRAHGVDLWWIDCDGDVHALIPHFLAGGVNIMFPWEVNGSGHPGAALDRYGPELRIMGGVDKMVLGRGRAEIRAYLETLRPYVARGGFIPFCDHRCPPNVAPDDYLYYLDLKEAMFGLGA